MKREQISEIISGVDMRFVEEARHTRRLYSPKKLLAVGLVATMGLSLVAWTGNFVMKHLALGGTYTQSHDPLLGTTTGSVSMGETIRVFEEIEGEVFFTYEDNHQNITEYCTSSTYFAHEVLDESGNGFVIVIGGSEGNRGQFVYNFEDHTMFAGTGDFDGDGDMEEGEFEPTWLQNASQVYRTVRFQP